MEYNNFKEELLYKMKKIDVELTEKQVKQFYNYMNLLIEWNNNINLTAITEPKEIILKHFVDCATINKFIDKNKVLDIGTGAGFPGIPLKIINENLEITLADSLNKRIKFLDIVIEKLELNKIETIHARAEELAKNKKYRECYDIVVSRAVAALNVLLEYTTPFIKVGGKVICMKGNNVEEEIKESKNAIKILGTKMLPVEKVILPDTEITRKIITVEKIKNTPAKYPRKAGTPAKEPL